MGEKKARTAGKNWLYHHTHAQQAFAFPKSPLINEIKMKIPESVCVCV